MFTNHSEDQKPTTLVVSPNSAFRVVSRPVPVEASTLQHHHNAVIASLHSAINVASQHRLYTPLARHAVAQPFIAPAPLPLALPATPPQQIRRVSNGNMNALYESIRASHYLDFQERIGRTSGVRYIIEKEKQEDAMLARRLSR